MMMNIRLRYTIITILITLLFSSSCTRKKIELEKVRYLPNYMYIKNHFGTDLRSMEERNEFILVTGTIDTTTEVSPMDVAVIIIDKKEQVLYRNKSDVKNNEYSERYSGNGYTLTLNYKKGMNHLFSSYEGTLEISKGFSSAKYSIVGVDGYH